MRLTDDQIQAIKQLAHQIAGEHVHVRVFGSRLDDNARGGDLDLMLGLPEPADNPALMAARFSAKVSRLMPGRKVDVLIAARCVGKVFPTYRKPVLSGALRGTTLNGERA